MIVLRSNFTPDISLDLSRSRIGKAKSKLFQLFQPSFDLDVPVLGKYHYAPFGEPSGWGLAVFSLAAGLAIFGAFVLFRRLTR